MTAMKSTLAALGLLGGLVLASNPASAVPAGPAGLQAGETPVTQVRMMSRSERMMHKRMMQRRMMRKRMMRRM